MEENKKLNASESLELISSMIRSSRRKLARNSYRPFLIWGYTTLIVTLVELALHLTTTLTTPPAIRLWIWWLIPIIGGMLTLLLRDRHPLTKSPLDINIGTLWGVLTLAMFVMIAMTLIISGPAGYLILPMILLLIGAGTMITGEMIKLPIVKWGGFSAILGAIIICVMAAWFQCAVAETSSETACREIIELFINGQMVIFALSFVGSMIIPGHYMKRLYNKPEHD